VSTTAQFSVAFAKLYKTANASRRMSSPRAIAYLASSDRCALAALIAQDHFDALAVNDGEPGDLRGNLIVQVRSFSGTGVAQC
jgi:hypothetical protein